MEDLFTKIFRGQRTKPAAPVDSGKRCEVVAAHTQIERAEWMTFYEAHPPRATDPHYRLFEHVKRMMLATGAGCWICGTTADREIHHKEVEFAALMGVNEEKLRALHPEYNIADHEGFLRWAESEGNMLILCARHHRSPYFGIHHVPYPDWKLQQYQRPDLPPVLQPPPGR